MKYGKILLLVFIFLLGRQWVVADTVAVYIPPIQNDTTNPYTVSILTCGSGAELYSTFGHSAIRVQNKLTQTDSVYNWGMFDFSDPDFYIKYTRGKLLYWGMGQDFTSFITEYEMDKRQVTEQVLNLSTLQSKNIIQAITTNLLPENKYYKYDFLFDNCTTRIRDLFANTFGTHFKFTTNVNANNETFMDFLNEHLRTLHSARVGINLLLVHGTYKHMTSYESMFLPKYLQAGFDEATFDKRKIVGETNILVQAEPPHADATNWFLLSSVVICLCFIVLSFVKQNITFWTGFDIAFFLLLGLLGCFFMFMWLGTEHQVCLWNYNILWALPTHLLIAPFFYKKNIFIKQYLSLSLVLALLGAIIFCTKMPVEVFPIIILAIVRLYCLRKHIIASQKLFLSKK